MASCLCDSSVEQPRLASISLGPVDLEDSDGYNGSNTHTFPRAGVYTATLTGYAVVQRQDGQQVEARFLAPTSAAYIRG